MRKEGKDMAGRKRKKKRNRYRKHIIIWILLLLVTAHFCGGKLQQTLHKMPSETDWELIVVNKWIIKWKTGRQPDLPRAAGSV